jgi:2-iminobutanoate/2-iminopropanoate deaminase
MRMERENMPTEIRSIATDRAPKAIGPYSQAIVAGELVFCAGQGAIDPATGENRRGDVAAETERTLDNLAAVLLAAGSDLAHVVKTTVFLVDMADFAAMNEVYAKRFGEHRPARSTVGVAALPRGFRVEIECVAIRVT